MLSALMACTSLSTDVYLPAMPTMERQLHGDAELTITGFLIGFAIAQLVWGPISDRIGRKIPLFIGMALFAIGSVGCAMSDNMASVVFWRVFQAVGACVGPMLSRAKIVKCSDLFGSSQAAQMLSTLVIIMAIAPIVGTLPGGAILEFGSWHGIFWLMALASAIMFAMIFSLPETLPSQKRSTKPIVSSFRNYLRLLQDAKFMRYTLSVTFFYVAVYAFITGFVYIDYFGIPSKYYGFLFGINIVGVMALSFVNKKLVKRYALNRLLIVSTLVAALATGVLFAFAFFKTGGVLGVIIPMFFVFSMNGIIASCSNAAALDSVPQEMKGSAAALIGSLQYGSGILLLFTVFCAMLAAFSAGTPWTMSWIIALFVWLSALAAYFNK
ncbi:MULTISPECIES: multidrug effflux MFS transporter [Campylobacter]|uniref:multidrug effflux MFS transporter n=2 Tax=Campylobacteraceae TaxID=72294 RepID=UPI0022B2A483|nr:MULTISPECIES: multidrug effflux MFS transporter [Campylobacter]